MGSYFILLLISANVLHLLAQKPCIGAYCLPLSVEPKLRVHLDDSNSIFLGQDEKSGCTCRQIPNIWTLCFGRQFCRSFPKDLAKETPIFKLKGTQIDALKAGELNGLQHLETLEFEGNYNLTRIEPGFFHNMTKLRTLVISFNPNLRSLEIDTFEGLDNLQELFMFNNCFKKIGELALAVSGLKNLQHLDLSENKFEVIRNGDFEALRGHNLSILSLVLCQIEEIETEAFTPLKHLTTLRLGENTIKNISEVIARTVAAKIPLKSLNLYSMSFRKAPPQGLLQAISRSNITQLSLAKNQFEIINSDTFPQFLPNLELLDLREVSTLNITNRAFIKMPKLKILLLSGNKLPSIPEGVLLEQLKYLDLQHNSGYSYAAPYFSLFGRKFLHMKSLELLNLSFNRLHALYANAFEGLSNLKTLVLRNGTIRYIDNNTFADLPNLQLLDLENNNVFMENPAVDIFKGLKSLEVLLLGGCEITYIDSNIFRHLRYLRHLGLERNKLHKISQNDFRYLPLLKAIDLSQNNLQAWSKPVLKNNPQVRYFNIASNKIMVLTDAMGADFKNLDQLEMEGNPFNCDCTTFTYQGIFENNLLDNQSIFCAFPEATSNMTIKSFLKSPLKCYDTNIPLLVCSSSLLIALLVSTVLVYYYRWHLRYWLFLTRLYLSRKKLIINKKEKFCFTNYEYDAFVSYSNEDRNFVIRLVTMLENYPPYLKLCVYERDFQVGAMISENVLESVAKSRKTLLVISDSYAKSQWCRWESQIAEHHRLFFQNEDGKYVDDSLILIRLGPVLENHLTPTLKFLLKTRIYLQWDADERKQKVFWEKLRGALAPPVQLVENTHL